MDFASEKVLDSPLLATSSAARVFKSPIACLMIDCLQFLGCEVEDIFRVLESYDMGGTISDVACYIEEEEFSQHHEFDAHLESQMTFGTEGMTKVDFDEGKPVRLVVSAGWIPPLSPKETVSIRAGAQEIITKFVGGEFRCCSWDEKDLSILD